MAKRPYIYKYTIDLDGNYILTDKTKDISIYWLERILGKVHVKRAKQAYELIQIKNGHYIDANGLYLVKRKDLDFDIIEHFIRSCDGRIRSKQNKPYTADLKDLELLTDLGIKVYTYKHFAAGDKVLYDHYFPIKEENIDQDFLDTIEARSKYAIESYKNYKSSLDEKKLFIRWDKL